ncbi:MAG: hypothetical protein RJA98_3015 [Pseudomonadota bacterium]|jgi:hypothetical protein
MLTPKIPKPLAVAASTHRAPAPSPWGAAPSRSDTRLPPAPRWLALDAADPLAASATAATAAPAAVSATVPGDMAQQAATVSGVSVEDLFEQPAIQQRLRAAAEAAEASEAAQPGGEVTHRADLLMDYWRQRFIDSVNYILFVRNAPRASKQRKAHRQLRRLEYRLIQHPPPDLIAQVEALRDATRAEWQATAQAAADRFVVLAENEAQFVSVKQRASVERVWGLPDVMEPTATVAEQPELLNKGSREVAQAVINFMAAFRKNSRFRAKADNYEGHELSNPSLGGDPRHVGKYSFDVDLSGDIATGPDGFYDKAQVIAFFMDVDKAAVATNTAWVALYNDFAVAQAVNEALGRRHIGFSGGGGNAHSAPGSFHHGPAPYLLHIHFNIMPRALKAQYDSSVRWVRAVRDYAKSLVPRVPKRPAGQGSRSNKPRPRAKLPQP